MLYATLPIITCSVAAFVIAAWWYSLIWSELVVECGKPVGES